MNVMDGASLPLENGRYSLPHLPSAQGLSSKTIDKNSKLYQACEDFQSVFIKQMLDTMRQTVDKSSSVMQDNQGAKVFEDMLYDEYSKTMSKTAGFDLADNLYRQMAFLQNIPKTSS
jgi:Rod binding domain-containing protein